MAELQAQRTLVKSPPELWALVSDAQSLARHLGEFGEIKITRVEPETSVAWEGEHASGTIELAKSGWGTKITLKAELAEAAGGAQSVQTAEPEATSEPQEASAEPEQPAEAEEAAAPEPEHVAASEPVAAEPAPAAEAEPDPVVAATPVPAVPPAPTRRGLFARMASWFKGPEIEYSPREAQAVPVAPVPVAEPAPPAEREPEPQLIAEQPVEAEVVAEPDTEPPEPELVTEPEPDGPRLDGERAQAVLTQVLDDLGAAHHRPFSRG